MRLSKVRVQNYRSIRDTGWFDVESHKTIFVGPNEAGKTVLLQALQQINAPSEVPGFNPLRDYPRSQYNDITKGTVVPEKTTVVEARFVLTADDQAAVPQGFQDCTYTVGRRLDNVAYHQLEGGPKITTYGDINKDLTRLCAHVDGRAPVDADKPSAQLAALINGWTASTQIRKERAAAILAWLKNVLPYVDEANNTEEERHDRLTEAAEVAPRHDVVLDTLWLRRPVFVLFNNYFKVRPLIHLEHLAQRTETNILDDGQYDYGNQCLLKLLGFSARELSNLGRAAEPSATDVEAFKRYRDQLDKRSYQLNAASVRLTEQIRSAWLPNVERSEADRLRVTADGQYLKVVVEDELGVEIEIDQRSEGFQWLVSFFIVFFAEAGDRHTNAILLLDEPGVSLHGLKQRDFRKTISRLAEVNQTIYTTHSPFLVGPDELDLVRVIEMTDRKIGTKVHTTLTAGDPAALLPLQEALGYDLAQSLFAQQRNLVVEGLTDYWYIDATCQLLRSAGVVDLNDKIAVVPAGNAGKVVYYATILHAQKLKVASLLDSDAAGDQAARQDTLVQALGNKGILRTKDAYKGSVPRPEVEDLLRDTLIQVAKTELGWDVSTTATAQPTRAIVDIFAGEVADFSKYKLARAYVRWTRLHDAAELSSIEVEQWCTLVTAINKGLK